MNKRIILSTNSDPIYYNYAEIVVKAWRKFIPECKISFSYVGNSKSQFKHIQEISDDSYWFKELPDVPTSNHSKVARMIIASECENDICLFSDVDIIPLQSEYFNNLFDISEKNEGITCAGFDAPCYQRQPDIGKVPVCYMVGKGNLFKALSNPDNKKYDELIESWKDVLVFDTKESINKHPFSDESLYRTMFVKSNIPRIGVKRGWSTGRADYRIDRVAWRDTNVSMITKGYYIDCHTIRPYDEADEVLKEIEMHISEKKNEKI